MSIQQVSCCAVTVGLALVLKSASVGSVPDNTGRILATLRSYDAIVLNDFTLSAQVVNPRPYDPVSDSERLIFDITVTMKDDVWATRQVLDEKVHAPKFKERKEGHLQKQDYNRFGALLVFRDVQRSALYESDFHGVYFETRHYMVAPDNKVESLPAGPRVKLFKRVGGIDESDDLYVPLLLTAGRGYGQLIDEVIEEVHTKDGLVRCKTRGHYPDGTRSVLTISVDPQAAYLVRQARCERADNGFVLFEMTNEGVQWAGKRSVAEKGKFVFDPERYGRSPEGAFEVRLFGLKDGADQTLINDNRELLHHKFADGTRIMDYRSGELEDSTVGYVPRAGTPDPSVPSSRTRFRAVGLAVLGILLTALACIMYRRQRKRAS